MAELNLTYNAMKMELTIYPIDSQRPDEWLEWLKQPAEEA